MIDRHRRRPRQLRPQGQPGEQGRPQRLRPRRARGQPLLGLLPPAAGQRDGEGRPAREGGRRPRPRRQRRHQQRAAPPLRLPRATTAPGGSATSPSASRGSSPPTGSRPTGACRRGIWSTSRGRGSEKVPGYGSDAIPGHHRDVDAGQRRCGRPTDAGHVFRTVRCDPRIAAGDRTDRLELCPGSFSRRTAASWSECAIARNARPTQRMVHQGPALACR